jgi:signal transduction histidine kinase
LALSLNRSPAAQHPVNSAVNILLIDDEPRNLDVLESSLQSEDYCLVRALTAERALLALIDGEFAAIVLDVRLPEMSGFELANLIKQRKRTRDIPIIFLTAYYQEDKHVLEGYGTGAVDYLTKPINPEILRSKIAVFADLFRKSRALLELNRTLQQEIVRRQAAEDALRQVNDGLERRVQERTADLTKVNGELRERESEVVQARDRALAASRAKDDFFARLSHELRTPLNPVLLIASDAAANPKLPAEVRADFKRIAENVELEARLIDDLLDLNRIAEGKLLLDLRPFDFNALISDAIAMVRVELDQKRIALRLALQAEQSQVIGDDVRLRQVFWNVLRNAVKFTPPGGTISVESERLPPNGDLLVRVVDTGIGLTSQEIEHIFEAFAQGDHAKQSAPPRFGGLGLGLAISRMLVGFHGGSISAQSAGRDRGATFLIRLPLPLAAENRPAPAPEDDPPPLLPAGSASPRHRILLVEDHLPTATALTRLLVRRGYDVVTASSVTEARAAVGASKFDLLISDLGLPDGDGCDLMQELKGTNGLVGIALTGYGMDADVSRCQAAGFAAHLIKPVRMPELERVLHSALPKGASLQDKSGTP